MKKALPYLYGFMLITFLLSSCGQKGPLYLPHLETVTKHSKATNEIH